jgi:hypothetical protein
MAKKTAIPQRQGDHTENESLPELQPKEFVPNVIEVAPDKQPEVELKNVVKEMPKETPPVEFKKPEEPKTTEDKIIGFLKARNTGDFIPINDFLKSLFPAVSRNAPNPCHDQRTMKLLKMVLDRMVAEGVVIIEGNFHQRLSKHYYPDTTTGITHYYNLDTLPLRAKLR